MTALNHNQEHFTQLIRGEEAQKPLNVAIVGGGRACFNLLRIVDTDRLSTLNMKILGVADVDPEAPGLVEAEKRGLFVTGDFRKLYDLEGVNLIIELTGSEKLRQALFRSTPSHISIMDHRGARFLWDLIQMQSEKARLEIEHQRQLEREKKHTQTVLDSLPYRLMVVNREMTISMVNEPFLQYMNIRREDVLGRPCYRIRYGLDRPCGESGKTCYFEQVLRTRRTVSTIHEYARENGDVCFDVITVSPMLDEKGEVLQLVEVSRDGTDRIRLEREARKSNVFFQNVIQSTVDGIVVVDTRGNVLIFNEGMENLTGYSAREIMEHGHLESFYDMDVARENMKKMRSDRYGPPGKLNPTAMSVKTKGGEEIPVTLTASLIIIDGKETGSVGIFTDMREILKMRKDLEEAHLQLVQSEKIASVGRMAAGVAHEINNPLSGVLIYAELLKEALSGRPEHIKDVQEIIDQTLRCKKIVSELLEFSRQSIGKTSSFSLHRLINQCLNLLIHQALFQNIQVSTRIDRDIPQMVGDMGQLQQVFTNLFINAAHAMDGKGKLRITCDYNADDGRFILKVSDTGPGIPEALRDKIFDIFFTTKEVGKGTGLGLSISKNIVELHGGSITFECPPGGGTTFIIELPLRLSGTAEPEMDEPVFIGLDA